MSVKNKVMSLVLAVFVVYGALSYSMQYFYVLPSFVALEQEELQKNMKRVMQAVEWETRRLTATATDWATWDDTYAFASGNKSDYVRANLYPQVLQQLQIGYMGLFTTQGDPLWEMAYDLETRQELTHITIPAHHLNTAQARLQIGQGGIVLTEHGPLLLAARPILTSAAQGPARGVVVMGRFLDDAFVADMVEKNQVALRMFVLGQRRLDSAEAAVIQVLQAHPGIYIRTDAELAWAYSLLKDLNGQHALLVQIETPRTIYAKGMAMIDSTLLSLALMSAIIALVLMVSLHYLVLLPLRRLTEHVTAIDQENHAPVPIALYRRDELGVLAREFTCMVARLTEARRKITEQAFQAGVAEMADSVLNDIGNAMIPLRIRVEKLLAVVHQTPMAELQRTLTEHTDSKAAAEQRRELEDLVDRTGRELALLLPRVSRQLSGMSQRVENAKKILECHTSFSQCSSDLQRIAIARLVQDALTALGTRLAGVTVEVSPNIATAGNVLGHQVALHQVLINLLQNAAESARKTGATGVIQVDIDPACDAAAGAVHLRIVDNGVGIPLQNLRRIFQRDCQKKRSACGLGLYWSALAVAAMQGRLYAQSGGLNQGACLHLILRRAAERQSLPLAVVA